MGTIPLKFTEIHYGFEGEGIEVVDVRRPSGNDRSLVGSTGACYSWWKSLTQIEAHAELLALFAELVLMRGYTPDQVSEAFAVIEGWPTMIYGTSAHRNRF